MPSCAVASAAPSPSTSWPTSTTAAPAGAWTSPTPSPRGAVGVGHAHGGRRRLRPLRARGGRLRRRAAARARPIRRLLPRSSYLDLNNVDPGKDRYLLRYRSGYRVQSVPLRRAGARRGLHQPRARDRRAAGPTSTNGQDVVVFAPAALRQVVADVARGAGARAPPRARRLGGSHDHADGRQAGREARAHDPRGHRLQEGEGARPPADLPLAADHADRQRRSRHAAGCPSASTPATAPRTCARRSSTCWRCRASSAPSAGAAWR